MRRNGKVSWFNEREGFGFITDEDGGDVFVHYSEIFRDGFQTLKPGEEVDFDLKDSGSAPKAVDVRVKGENPYGSII